MNSNEVLRHLFFNNFNIEIVDECRQSKLNSITIFIIYIDKFISVRLHFDYIYQVLHQLTD